MKKLVAPGSVVIPSNLPRTRQGPDSRGFRICFQELGRSCALKQGFLIFTDGSAYAYDSPSNGDIEALCAQLQRGKVFNFSVRRSQLGFVRGFTPPADYETIYSFPPYEGFTPTACPLPNPVFNVLDWVVTVNSPGAFQTASFSLDPGTGDAEVLTVTCSVGFSSGTFHATATATYNGPAAACTAIMDFDLPTPSQSTAMELTVQQDGSIVFDQLEAASGSLHFEFPFMLNDTLGLDSALQVDMDIAVTSNLDPGVVTITARLTSP